MIKIRITYTDDAWGSYELDTLLELLENAFTIHGNGKPHAMRGKRQLFSQYFELVSTDNPERSLKSYYFDE